MAATRAHLRKPLARSASDLSGRAASSWDAFVVWWRAQADHRRLTFVVVGLVATISVLNFAAAATGRLSASQAAAQPASVAAAAPRVLLAESAPVVPGRAWVATQLWQGSTSRVTESFTVGAHWRVDWLYNPPQSGGIFQVFVYAADGALLMAMAANTQASGADSSFWAGPGTYFLKVNSTGGDWKLDVQDLR